MSEIAIRPLIPEVLCSATAGRCLCVLPAQHDPDVHECDPVACGGQWRGNYDDETFEPVRMPSLAKAFMASLGGLF